LEATIATTNGSREAHRLVQHLDSLSRLGVESINTAAYEGYTFGSQEANLLLARLFEREGDPAAAVAALRRRAYHHMVGYFERGYSSTSFREEGRLTALLGDRQAALRAYRNYLALRDQPEPALAAEVAHIRAEVSRLEREVADEKR
jgi:hypothetical protein